MENPIQAKLENARDVARHMHGRELTNPSHSFRLHRVRIVRPSRLCLTMHSYMVQKKIKVVDRSSGIRASVFSKEVGDALFKLLERERSAGHAVSNRLLSEEALRIASQLQLGNFVPSSQYLKRWKHRFNVSMQQATNDSQKVPEECADAAKSFRSALGCLRSRHEYTLHNMANIDQTLVRMDTAANRTNKRAGTSTVRIANTGCARQGFTVVLGACTSGHKLPAFAILKEQGGKIPTRAFTSLRIPRLDDLGEIPRVAREDMGARTLTTYDSSAKDTIQERDTNLVYVPAGCTSLPQPADVFWNKPFKASLRRTWEAFMRKEEKTAKGNLRKPSRQDVHEFVYEAWASVPEETVAHSFTGCGIANALDNTRRAISTSSSLTSPPSSPRTPTN
ncbi:hypothetical protein HPB47_003143 [Ixodes persulcatus]|uniref:Uncharacterized protein n=1 Tax=Ixodes persulcatus TaxID=34615 RepID=A0AC60PJ88_IXOPE|nr:hypothetical protein HPB47_003143 [Ixodes persulcatus]